MTQFLVEMNKYKPLSLLLLLTISAILLASACDQLPLDAAVQADSGELEESQLAVQLSPKRGYIALLGNDGNIYTLNQAGEDITPITADASNSNGGGSTTTEVIQYLLPAWSTDGQKLAYVQFQQSSSEGNDFADGASSRLISLPAQEEPETRLTYSIIATDRQGSNRQTLWSGTARPIYLYWSPNQEFVSALLQEGASPALRLTLLSTVDGTIQVIDVGSPLFWDWAPNGKQILTHIGSQLTTERISLLDIGTSSSKDQLETAEEVLSLNPSPFMSPDISPTGSTFSIPISSDEEGDDDTWLAIYDVSSRERKIIERLDGLIGINPSFSPDGSQLAYVASKATDGTNKGELAVYNLRTGELTISQAKNIIAFFWSPDGKKIAWIETFGPAESTANGGRLGLYLFDVEQGTEIELIRGFETTVQFTEVLNFYSQYQRSATIWSPDSRRLVVPIQSESKSEIKVVHFSGSTAPRTIAEGTLAFWSAE